MTNNFDLIKYFMLKEGIPLFHKDVGDLFFCIQLIRRGKDHPNLPAANYTFKSYYIDSIEKYDNLVPEIVKCCELFGLRAYVSVNVKSKEAFTKYCNYQFAQNVFNNEYKKPWNVIDHVFGKLKSKNHYWIVDIDNFEYSSWYVQKMKEYIDSCDSKYENNVVTYFPTKSGIHLITHPFNLQQFTQQCNDKSYEIPDIKKDHITLLYENL